MSRILFVSHSDIFGAFRVGSHHLSAALAEIGHDVVHVSTPVSLAHRALRRVPAERLSVSDAGPREADGVQHLIPRSVVPAGLVPFDLKRCLARYPETRGRYDVVLIDQPLLWSKALKHLATTVVYRPTDEYPAGLKARLQRQILRDASGVVATSPVVLSGLGELAIPSIVVPNGVAVDMFATESGVERRPRCIYVGAFDARFDWQQVQRWAGESPDVEFVLAGPAGPVPAGLPGNVEMRGAVPYADLPGLLQSARVGLLPLSDDPLNAGRSPMKLFEYLASGMNVVSRRTPVITDGLGAGVFTYGDAEEARHAFAAAMKATSPNVEGRRRAAEEGWHAKAERILDFVKRLDPR